MRQLERESKMQAYEHNGKKYCANCAAKVASEVGSEGITNITGNPSDFPEHCHHCETFLQNPLTDKGKENISRIVSVAARDVRNRRGAILEWMKFYNMVLVDPYSVMDEQDYEPEYEPEDEERPYSGVYSISIYLVSLEYGGAEEGGWWFDAGQPILEPDFPLPEFALSKEEAYSIRRRMAQECERLNVGRREKSSVISEGVYEAHICEGMPSPFPRRRPRYS